MKALTALLILASGAYAQCPGGVCLPPAQYVPAPQYQWRTSTVDPAKYRPLYLGEVQVGTFDIETGLYHPMNPDRTFGEPCAAPVPTPAGTAESWRTTGVDRSRIPQTREYHQNGKIVPEAKAKAALTDDSGKLAVVVVKQSQADADAIAKSLRADPAFASANVTGWASDSPMMQDGRVTTDGTVYIQDSSGKVLHRGVYTDNAKLAEALRKARPNYNPQNDPDLTKGGLSVPFLGNMNMTTLLVVGVVLFLLLRK